MGRSRQVIAASDGVGVKLQYVPGRDIIRVSRWTATGGSSRPIELSLAVLVRELGIDTVPSVGRLRYVLFAGLHESPRGGARDVYGTYDHESQARHAFSELRSQRTDKEGWAQLVALDRHGKLHQLGWFGLDSARPGARDQHAARSRWLGRIRSAKQEPTGPAPNGPAPNGPASVPRAVGGPDW